MGALSDTSEEFLSDGLSGMEKNSRAEGKKGEKAAEKVLRKKGYKILERNYTARMENSI